MRTVEHRRITGRLWPLTRALAALAVFVGLVRLVYYVSFSYLGLSTAIHAASSSRATLVNMLFDLLLVAIALALYRWLNRAAIAEMGLGFGSKALRLTGTCLALLLAQYIVLMIVTGLMGVTWSIASFTLPSVFRAFLVMLGVGIGEEFFFRGYIFNTLRSYGRLSAYVVSCLIFAMAHFAGEPFHFMRLLGTFLPGLLFTYIYEQSGSIWPGSLVHAAMNLLSLFFIRQVPGVSLMRYSGSGSMVERMWSVSYTLTIILLTVIIRRTYSKRQAPSPALKGGPCS